MSEAPVANVEAKVRNAVFASALSVLHFAERLAVITSGLVVGTLAVNVVMVGGDETAAFVVSAALNVMTMHAPALVGARELAQIAQPIEESMTGAPAIPMLAPISPQPGWRRGSAEGPKFLDHEMAPVERCSWVGCSQ